MSTTVPTRSLPAHHTVTPTTGEPVVRRLRGRHVEVQHGLVDVSFARQGWNSWSPTAWQPLRDRPWRVWGDPDRSLTAEDVATDDGDVHRGYLVGAVQDSTGATVLLGALTAISAQVDAHPDVLVGHCDEETEWFVATGSEEEVFERFGEALAAVLGVAERSSVAPSGRHAGPVWSSWYSWFEEVTQDIVVEEVPHAADLGYDVVQIDDGWERAVGDWWPNADFSRGMADVAARITDAGMRAGLWLSPFIAMPEAPVAREHPEFFLRRGEQVMAAGYNWGRHYWALDLSRDDALEWLSHEIARIVGWGYSYLKIDFIYAGALAADRAVDMPRHLAYRRGLEAVRRAAGDDVYVMGSGAVVAPSLGVLDGMRVGPDTAPYWDNGCRPGDPSGPAVANAVRNSLSRLWLKRWIDIDPDVVFARTRGSLLSPEANRLTQDLARVCGVVGCSDPRSWLTDEEADQISALNAEARRGFRVERLSRHRFTVEGGREVDFGAWLSPRGRISDRLVVK